MIHQKPKSYSPSSYLEIVTPGAHADGMPLLVVFTAPQLKMISKHLWWFDWGADQYQLHNDYSAACGGLQISLFQPILCSELAPTWFETK